MVNFYIRNQDRVQALGLFSIFSLLIFILAYFLFSNGCGESGTGFASLSITTPSPVVVGIKQSVTFSAIARDTSGKIVSVTPSWSVVGGIGTITSGGVFIAGATTGEGKVIATANDLSAEASVIVTDAGEFRGTIFDTTGNTVQSIKVYLMGYIDKHFDFSDSSGKYLIPSVPAGTYEIWTVPTSVYGAASTEAISLSAGQTKNRNLTVVPFSPLPPTIPPTYTP